MANVIPTNVRRLGAKAASPLVVASASYNIGSDCAAMLVNNGSGASITATISTPGAANSVVTFGAGVEDVILFQAGGGGPKACHAVTLSAVTSVTVGFYTSS